MGKDLRVNHLAANAVDSIFVSRQHENLVFGSNIPNLTKTHRRGQLANTRQEPMGHEGGSRGGGTYSGNRVTTTSDKNIQPWMEFASVASTQVTMILSNDLVLLQVPALDQFVLPCGEHVGAACGNGQPPDCRNMACQGDLQLARRQIPQLQQAQAHALCQEPKPQTGHATGPTITSQTTSRGSPVHEKTQVDIHMY